MRQFLLILILFGATSHPAKCEPHRATAVVKLENAAKQDPAALQEFVELVEKGPALHEIVARLVLSTAWNMEPEKAAARLASILEVTMNGKDGLITAKDESPVMAATIANTAAAVLQTRKGKVPAEILLHLDKSIQEQTDMVADKKKLIDQINRQAAIILENPPEALPTPAEPRELHEAGYSDAGGDFERSKQLLQQLKEKKKQVESEKALKVHHVIWARVVPD